MRPIAIGRRNWTFAGSDAGGERAAAIYSLIETAKLHELDPEAYLRRIIEASSNPGDLALDCFAGSGTTLAVADLLGRDWIGAGTENGGSRALSA